MFTKFRVFELSMSYKLIEAQRNMTRLNLKDILIEKVSQDEVDRPLDLVQRRIKLAGHVNLIKTFFEQFFRPTDTKKNTLMIEGISNSGKTKLLERLMLIFPCIAYVQQHGSRFAADYSDGQKYNHTKYHPSFIIVDEGAYSDFMDHGDLADAK